MLCEYNYRNLPSEKYKFNLSPFDYIHISVSNQLFVREDQNEFCGIVVF